MALARALVIRPRCLLLDEPLSNLDAKMRLQMRGEIRRVCKEHGLTAIYVTHDQKEALSIADRLAILERGHLAQVGTPREIYRQPRTRAVADFIGESNFIEGKALEPVEGSEHWRVSTGLGEFTGLKPDPAWDLHVGEPVVLSIRPESWKLQEGASANGADHGGNTVRGRIGRSTYLGEVAEYDFQPQTQQGNATALKMFELNPRFVEAASSDTQVTAHVSDDDVIVLHP